MEKEITITEDTYIPKVDIMLKPGDVLEVLSGGVSERKKAFIAYMDIDYIIKSSQVVESKGSDYEFKTPFGKYLVFTNEEAAERTGIPDTEEIYKDWSYTRRGKKLAEYDGAEGVMRDFDQTFYIYKLDEYDYSRDYWATRE